MSDPRRPRVAIDLVPIHAGRGGAGGGIWTYAASLIEALDSIAQTDIEVSCLSRPDQPLPSLVNVRRVMLSVDTTSPARRLHWIHRTLPAWCSRNDVAILHKLASEVPWWSGRTALVTTVQDFMQEFMQEFRQGRSDARSHDNRLTPPPPGRSLRGRLQGSYFEAVTRRAFERSSVILTTTDCVAAEARRRFPNSADRVRTVPLGVDHAALAPATASPVAAGMKQLSSQMVTAEKVSIAAGTARPLRLLFVGAFLPHKGQHLAIAAFERLLGAHPELAAGATLTLRGHPADAAYHTFVRATASASVAAESIRFASYDSAASPRARYADADILLQLSAYEGFGLPPLEAQAAGIAVVCADIPVFREVLGDGALFVDRADPNAIASAVASLAANPALSASVVSRGQANAATYSWARTAAETVEVYREVADRNG